MFFYLSKIIWLFLQPTALLIFIALTGACLLWSRFFRLGRRLVLGSSLTLLIASFSPLGHILLLPLEERFPRIGNDEKNKPADGIIILGGSLNTPISLQRKQTSLTEAAERITEALSLAHKFPYSRIVYSGGSGALFYAGGSEARQAIKFLQAQNISLDRLSVESRSRNTYENAVFTKELVKPKPGERWLLVTSAYHMPRSIGCFRKVGFLVEPWPVDYRTRGSEDRGRFFSQASEGLRRIDLVSREWLGLIAYWLSGRTSAVFPAPI